MVAELAKGHNRGKQMTPQRNVKEYEKIDRWRADGLKWSEIDDRRKVEAGCSRTLWSQARRNGYIPKWHKGA
jgi:hypothetical protein